MLHAGTKPVLICQQMKISNSSVSRISARMNDMYSPITFTKPAQPTELTRGQRAAATRKVNRQNTEAKVLAKSYCTVVYGTTEFVVPTSKRVQFHVSEDGSRLELKYL